MKDFEESFLVLILVLLISFIFLIFAFAFAFADAFADDASKADMIYTFLEGKETETIRLNKDKVIQDLRDTFGVQEEDLAFIFSIRAARLPVDGFDFLKNPTALVQLVTLYKEAKDEWKKPISVDFYDFFKKYASQRMIHIGSGGKTTIEGVVEEFYQLEHAKKHFKLPY